jgi:arsenite methyltransferase
MTESMAEVSYRLGHYQIIEKDDGELCWKSHGGFASVRTGKCFIEGDILFIGQREAEEHGQLKNEFLYHVSKLPNWTRTRYYCPSYTLVECNTGKNYRHKNTSQSSSGINPPSSSNPNERKSITATILKFVKNIISQEDYHSFTIEETERIKQGIKHKYAKVALSPEGNFRYPTGREGLEGQNYDLEIIESLPEDVIASFCGVGNPFVLGHIHEGDAVLDIGCGAGVDTLVAALMTGYKGKVVGVDLVPNMLERAKGNLARTSIKNVEFLESSGESLPFENDSFDVVISNGAFNLIPDKARALNEVFRVLRPDGRFMIADQVLTGESPTDIKSMIETWHR